ncbi:hypothetical protein C8F04DRAFT_1195080 [Mycena alexandri]|uniref:Uncharacterized protein n=1 Tax=Mycena alexandri TaxID=1745969 RepID=A0AAD6SAB5_9AGAR|nr:hypothetical protein C8F04DRAFT_1195080 [Mycena alexandri]
MSGTPMIFDCPAIIAPTSSTSSLSSPRSTSLRDRCGFTLYLSFAPALPDIPAKGHLGPTAGNLPRRRRSSVVSIDLSTLAKAPIDANALRAGNCMCSDPMVFMLLTTHGCIGSSALNVSMPTWWANFSDQFIVMDARTDHVRELWFFFAGHLQLADARRFIPQIRAPKIDIWPEVVFQKVSDRALPK